MVLNRTEALLRGHSPFDSLSRLMVAGIVVLIVAILVTVEAWLVREGVIQKWPRRYYAAKDAPLHIRMGVFGLVPFAVACAMWGAGIVLGNLSIVGGGIVLGMAIVGFASFIVAFGWMKKPPEWVKPEWLKRAERGEEDLDDLAAVHGGRRLVAVPPWQYWATWAFVVVLLLLWLVLKLPASTLIGIGCALPILAAGRPTRHPPD